MSSSVSACPWCVFVCSKQILQTYKTDAKMEEMMKNVDFYVTPVLNMDGYIYTWENETVSPRIW